MSTIRSSSLVTALATAALSVALLAGCGGGAKDTAGGSPSPTTSNPGSSAPGSVSPSPSPSGAPTSPAAPSSAPVPPPAPPGGAPIPPGGVPQKGEISVTGQVEDGVESRCLLLRTPERSYLLLGGDRTVLRAGARVTVRGKVEEGQMTTCMQGTPFQVVEAKPA